jgi:hypothetical protein
MVFEWRFGRNGKVAIAMLAAPLFSLLPEIVAIDNAAVWTDRMIAIAPSDFNEMPEGIILTHEGNVIDGEVARCGGFQKVLRHFLVNS